MVRALLCFAVLVGAAGVSLGEDGRPLFNGKDLDGWKGNPDVWSVKDGAITGTTTDEKPLTFNTFLVWQGGKPANFELRAKYKMVGNNSGIQYRSKVVDPANWVVAGYQGDMDGDGKYIGMLYEEKGRGIVALPGQAVKISAGEGKPKIEVTGQTTPPEQISAAIKRGDWNEYVIIAEGNHLRHFINGLPTADVTDLDEAVAASSGVLALQLHAGPPMAVQFKNIRLKVLP